MNIVILGPAHPYRGGIAHSTASLTAQLRKRHQVTMVTFSRQYPGFLFPGKSQEESGPPHEEINAVPVPRWVDSINPLNWIVAGRRIARLKPDVLVVRYWLPFFGPCFGTIVRIVKRTTRATIIYLCDNIIPHERRPGDVLFTKYAFPPADGFIVQSGEVERQLLQYFPHARYRKAPHPVYDRFGTGIPKEKAGEILGIRQNHVLLFFGIIRKYKGLGVLLDAFAEFLAEARRSGDPWQDALLLVVGEFYEDEQAYRDQAEQLKISERVMFVSGYVPTETVATYFCASDVAVLPYFSATQSGIAQIAYNFNIPVITTSVGGLAEIVIHGKTGFLVPPGDPKALAGMMREFYAGKHGEQFAAAITEEKKKYTWEFLAENIEQLIGEVRRRRKLEN